MSLDTIWIRNWSEAGKRWMRWAAVPALALLLAGSFARPAQAGDEFEDAFKYELGRIAAHEAVFAGRHLLGTLVAGANPYAGAPTERYPVYVAVPQIHQHYHHGRGHGHYRDRGHPGHGYHRHDRHCGHGWH